MNRKRILDWHILGKNDEAMKWINDSLEIDRFNMSCRFEKGMTRRICKYFWGKSLFWILIIKAQIYITN
jgi:hypothetical protein